MRSPPGGRGDPFARRDSGGSGGEDAPAEALVAGEIDVRHRLAELGYGPLERPKLTHVEQRELLEGSIRAERRRLDQEVRLRGGDPDKQEAKQRKNDEMVSDLQADIDAVKSGGGGGG